MKKALIVWWFIFSMVGPAHAAIIMGDYYEDQATTVCAKNDSACRFSFPITPATKYLTIKTLSCSLDLSGGIYIKYATIGEALPGKTPGRLHRLNIIVNQDVTTFVKFSTISDALFLKVPPARVVTVAFLLSNTGAAARPSCIIDGTLSDQ